MIFVFIFYHCFHHWLPSSSLNAHVQALSCPVPQVKLIIGVPKTPASASLITSVILSLNIPPIHTCPRKSGEDHPGGLLGRLQDRGCCNFSKRVHFSFLILLKFHFYPPAHPPDTQNASASSRLNANACWFCIDYSASSG